MELSRRNMTKIIMMVVVVVIVVVVMVYMLNFGKINQKSNTGEHIQAK